MIRKRFLITRYDHETDEEQTSTMMASNAKVISTYVPKMKVGDVITITRIDDDVEL